MIGLLLVLSVIDPAPAGKALSDFSRLVTLPPNGTATIKFVVPPPSSSALLLRVDGPSLHSLGYSPAVLMPEMRVFDANGTRLFFADVRRRIKVAQAKGGPPILASGQPNWPEIFDSVGAFQLDGGEQAKVAYDYGIFRPGTYTVTIEDGSMKGGLALFELYSLSGVVATTAPPVLPEMFGEDFFPDGKKVVRPPMDTRDPLWSDPLWPYGDIDKQRRGK
jgi:hypothetical protein